MNIFECTKRTGRELAGLGGRSNGERVGGHLYLCRKWLSVGHMFMVLQKPKIRAEVHEIVGWPDSYQLELSKVICSSRGRLPITGSSPKLLLGGGRGAGDLY